MSESGTEMAPMSGQDGDGKGVGRVVSKIKNALKSDKREAAASDTQRPSSPRADSRSDTKQESAPVSAVLKLKILEERARKLGEKFGLVIESSDLSIPYPDETVLRVDKPIRMRVRRTCHRCNTAFTTGNECRMCQHVRCERCPRHPPKEAQAELLADLEHLEAEANANKENAPIVPDYFWGDERIELKRPSKTGGQDLVHRKPRQRVRRTCHECQTLFATGSRKCENCNHIRCTDCPRDPPKKDKYPFGYPGDAFGSASDARFECNACEVLYPVGAEDGTPCTMCGLVKSAESPRALPRKVQPAPDLEVLSRLQAKLAVLGAKDST
ncbi:uncharacterized protein MAM_04391 [Metarhizium album ARSEF 1941]|uniref:Zinc finger, FYVE/PHD-type n=1 Tax=Metarhizium album (strain ARSEF 1941) TaxID=1081103 RepID=A0A0B2WX41_METAS|nr:uncharacterized protein MAM_04391 [Metarhizium album ARSEF 1941]KHN98002.1 hypothetical protein MAM_04391 [Metarhizium album ARSEF 1941]